MANLSNINNKFIVTDGGNVLIGPTGNTSYRLDVSGNIRVPYANGYFMDTTGTAGSNFVKTINDYETVVGTDRGSAGFAVIGNSNIRIGFGQAYTAAQTSLFINSSGDVGIGTTTMNTTLNLYSASNTQIGFQDASTGVGTADGFRIGYNGTYGQLWLFENADFRIATNNTQRFSIDNDGITTVGNRGSDLVYDPTAYQNDLIIERKNADGNNQLATIRFNVTGYTGQTTGEASIGAVQTSNASSADLVFGTRNNGTRSEKMRIDSSGDVGIGTDTPGTKLEIKKQIPAGNRTVPLDILTIFGYGPNVLPYTGSGGAIVFKNTSYTYGDLKSARIRSYIDSDSGSNRGAGLVFEVTNSNQTYNPSLFLKYDGNVGIGTSSPAAATRLDVAGGTKSTFYTSDGGRGFKQDGAAFVSTYSNGADGNAVNDIGSTTNRWRDGFFSGGVYLGGTAAANKLDDYEEGGWTPVASDFTGNQATVNTTNSTGVYTKIGDLVYWRFTIQMTSKASMISGETFKVSGFPFTSSSIPGNWYRPSSAIIKQVTFSGFVNFSLVASTTYGYFFDSQSAGAGGTIPVSDIADNCALSVTGVYKAN